MCQSFLICDHHFAPPPDQAKKWRTRKADWTQYRLALGRLDTIFSGNLDEDAQALTETVLLAAKNAVPFTKARTRATSQLPPSDAKLAWQREISLATRTFMRFPSDASREELRAVQRAARLALKTEREESTTAWCKSLETLNTPQLWKEVNRLKGSTPNPLVADPAGKAEALVRQFTTRGNTDLLPAHVQEDLLARSASRTELLQLHTAEPTPTDAPFTPHELKLALRLMRSTTPGGDGLSSDFYREATPAFHDKMLHVFNMSWKLRRLPLAWKEAKIIAIPKPNNNGARPISLLQCISKIMERMVHRRLQYVIPANDQLYGFAPGRGTADAVTQLVHRITQAKRRRVVVVYFDLEKAFERANRLATMEALATLGVRGNMLGWTSDFMSERAARVCVQGTYSSRHSLENGVPQGSVISPTLFNALMAALITSTEKVAGTSIIAYADDIALVCDGRIPLQKAQLAISLLARKAATLGLAFAPAKTAATAFHSVTPTTALLLDDKTIQWANHHKYLGVTIDRKLAFTAHTANTVAIVSRRTNMLRVIGHSLRGCTSKTLMYLYKALIQSILHYAASALLTTAKSNLRKLDIAQRRALRTALALPRWTNQALLHLESGCAPISLAIPALTVQYAATRLLKRRPTQASLMAHVWEGQRYRTMEGQVLGCEHVHLA